MARLVCGEDPLKLYSHSGHSGQTGPTEQKWEYLAELPHFSFWDRMKFSYTEEEEVRGRGRSEGEGGRSWEGGQGGRIMCGAWGSWGRRGTSWPDSWGAGRGQAGGGNQEWSGYHSKLYSTILSMGTLPRCLNTI